MASDKPPNRWGTPVEFAIAVALIGLCYGGGFGTMPSFTTGNYLTAIHVINVVMLVALLLPLLAHPPHGRAQSPGRLKPLPA